MSLAPLRARTLLNHLGSMLLLGVLYWIVAGASFSGYVAKWGLRDASQTASIGQILDGTAHQPFVYRQLAPMLSGLALQAAPEGVQGLLLAKIKPEESFARIRPPDDPRQRFRVLVVYGLAFAALIGALFVLRRIALDSGLDPLPASIAPVALVLALPYFQTIGGYFYDSIELLFLSAAYLAALRGKVFVLLALALPATLNKETFLFFVPTLYPLLRVRLAPLRAGVVALATLLLAGAVNVWLKWIYADVPGGVAEFHLLGNLGRYLDPATYLGLEITYGVPGPSGAFVGTLAVLALVVARGWPASPPALRRHLLLAATINLPLLLVFSATGELRNLSFLYVGLALLVARAMDRKLTS
jgi:hypothetical protein